MTCRRSTPPRVEAKVNRLRVGDNGVDYEIVVEIDGVDIRARAAPPALQGRAMKRGERDFPEAELDRLIGGFIPDHLGLSAEPLRKVKPRRTIFERPPRDRKVATTIFNPDDRVTFQDTDYPWSTVGLVETNRGSGSGVMIGPRHLLTVSHVIDWTAPAGFAADWVRFTPSYFDGDAPFGESFGTHIYWYVKEDGDGFISREEPYASFTASSTRPAGTR